MAVYGILSLRPEARLSTAIEKQYEGKTFPFSDCVFFVSTNDAPRQIAAKIGVQHRSGDGTVVAGMPDIVVTKLSPAYYGWANSALWEWMKLAHQEESS